MNLAPTPIGEEFCAVEFFDILESAEPLYDAIAALPLHRRCRHIELACVSLLLYLDSDRRAQLLQSLSKMRESLN
jgi:hypothetical protein